MADEITIQTRLYGVKGGAYLPAYTTTAAWDMVGGDFSSSTHQSATGSDAALDVGSCTGDMFIEIANLENEATLASGYIQLSTATGGSFAASVFAIIPQGTSFLGCKPSGTTWYHKAVTAAQDFQIRVAEI